VKKRGPARKKAPKRARASAAKKKIAKLKKKLAKLPVPKKREKSKRRTPPKQKKLPARQRKSGPKPPKPRAPSRERTDAERQKARRLRKKLASGDGLTPAQSAWLDAYEDAVGRGKRARSARSKSAKNRGAMGDAEDIVQRLAEWFGGTLSLESAWQRDPAPGRPGTATATAGIDWTIDPDERPRDALPGGAPDLGGSLGPNRAVTLRVQIETRSGTRWATAVAFTEREADAEVDFVDAVADICDAYEADAVTAVAAYVGGFT
jgi:hypothetical protein